jgi:hypothetical protein
MYETFILVIFGLIEQDELRPMIISIVNIFLNMLLEVFNYKVPSALAITFGGMCMLPQHRGGACFCTRGAMQGYDVDLVIVALAKTVTPAGGPRREPGRAAPPTTKRSSLARKFSRCGAAIAYTDLL